MTLKNVRRGRIKEYAEKYPAVRVHGRWTAPSDHNPLWNHKAHCAFPSRHPERDQRERDAQKPGCNNGVYLVCEGANMPTTPEAV
jgi:glutamate dehydrogenase (NADP+)